MLKSVVLTGLPGAGKTRLMRGLRERLRGHEFYDWGLLCFDWFGVDNVILPGIWWPNSSTPGSDQLQPEASAWIDLLVRHQFHYPHFRDACLCIDGHKLLSSQFMATLRNQTEHTMIRLVASDAIRAERLEQRPGGPMDPDYAADLAVRYAWLSATYEPSEVWRNETEADYRRNLARLCALVGIETEVEVA